MAEKWTTFPGYEPYRVTIRPDQTIREFAIGDMALWIRYDRDQHRNVQLHINDRGVWTSREQVKALAYLLDLVLHDDQWRDRGPR